MARKHNYRGFEPFCRLLAVFSAFSLVVVLADGVGNDSSSKNIDQQQSVVTTTTIIANNSMPATTPKPMKSEIVVSSTVEPTDSSKDNKITTFVNVTDATPNTTKEANDKNWPTTTIKTPKNDSIDTTVAITTLASTNKPFETTTPGPTNATQSSMSTPVNTTLTLVSTTPLSTSSQTPSITSTATPTFVSITSTSESTSAMLTNGTTQSTTLPTTASPQEMKKSPGNTAGGIAAVAAIIFLCIIVLSYTGLLLWRRYIIHRYGNRELLVNDLEFDTNDLRHFEL